MCTYRHSLRASSAAAAFLLAASSISRAADEPPETSFHFQATYIAQHKPSFSAAYTGPNSLTTETATAYTFTTTFFMAGRLWQGGEWYANLEGVQGVPFSNLTGLGGFPNGELQKTVGSALTWYRARLFARQTFGFGGGTETIEEEKNQLAVEVDRRRLVLIAGNLAATDLFDNNRYAHDPRTDFFNWAVMDSGAYDYAADARGYSWGVAAEWHDVDWAFRAGRFLVPKESNGLALDTRILEHYGDQFEFEKRVLVAGREGTVRVLLFHNVAIMGKFGDAIALGRRLGQPPDLTQVRRRNSKWGGAVNLEQSLGTNVGAFARLSWNDGRTEAYSFTEIDRSVALGGSIKGQAWGRDGDEVGVAFLQNGLSPAHREYLAAGGSGFFLGDGRLSYQPERISEVYYSVGLGKLLNVSLDAQHVAHPGYNSDRGPVNFYGVRAHFEF